MDGKPNADLFHKALEVYAQMDKAFDTLIETQNQLIKIDSKARANEGNTNKEYEQALSNVLSEIGKVERLSSQGTRYALIAGMKSAETKQFITMSDLLQAQLEDMHTLRRKSAVAIDSFRSAIPLAERSEFVNIMLSGRNAFGDVMPQFTDMISAFERFYIRGCMATVSATMQTYPSGWTWLKKQAR